MPTREELSNDFSGFPVKCTQEDQISGGVSDFDSPIDIQDAVDFLQKFVGNVVVLDIEGVQVAVCPDPKDRSRFCVKSDLLMCKEGDEPDASDLSAMDALLSAVNPDGPFSPGD